MEKEVIVGSQVHIWPISSSEIQEDAVSAVVEAKSLQECRKTVDAALRREVGWH